MVNAAVDKIKEYYELLVNDVSPVPYILFYQSPLIISELFQHNLINVLYLTACYLYQDMMTLHVLNDVANDAESTQKIKNYVIIASLKSVHQWVN